MKNRWNTRYLSPIFQMTKKGGSKMPDATSEYIANMAVRYFLTKLGEQLGYEKFNRKRQWDDVLRYFNGKCCYCGEDKKLERDHVVGINKKELGFHYVGNIAPACPSCNRTKNNMNGNDERFAWEIHLETVSTGGPLQKRRTKIDTFMRNHNYPPDFNYDIRRNYQKNVEDFYRSIQDQVKRKTDVLLNNIKNNNSEQMGLNSGGDIPRPSPYAQGPLSKKTSGYSERSKETFNKVHKIKRWANHPEQINHKIIRAYLHLEKNGDVRLDDLRSLCSDSSRHSRYYVKNFNDHYSSMKTDNGHSHGKVFYDKNGLVSIWVQPRKEINTYFA